MIKWIINKKMWDKLKKFKINVLMKIINDVS